MIALALMAAGPAAAVAQISDSGQAAEVQYPDLTEPKEPAPEASAPRVSTAEPVEDSDLPVTGFVAIPLLVTGGVLLLVGGVMHVRTRRD